MAADRQRLAQALAAEAARRRMFESIPEAAGQGLPQAPDKPMGWNDYLENLSIGLGRGAVNQMEGIKGLVTSPVESLKGMATGAVEAVRNPRMVAEMLKQTAQRATSGPLGLGEVVGENVNMVRMPKGVDKREIFIGKTARTWDAAAAKRAEELEATGMAPEEIWRETGTFRAPDGQLRQEISDVGAKLREEPDYETAIQGKKAEIAAINQRVRELKEGAKTQPDLFPREFNRGIRELAAQKKPLREDIEGNYGLEFGKSGLLGARARLAFEHPGGLYEAYPEIGQRTIVRREQPLGSAMGTYNRESKSVSLSPYVKGKPQDANETMLHELQHAIQHQEGFSGGGNPDLARRIMQEDMQQRYAPYSSDSYKRAWANVSIKEAARANYAQFLEKLQKKDNPKPRDLTSLSDWYKYGTRISQEMDQGGYGWQMPKKAGANRDYWIRQAARRMQRMIEEDRPDMRDAATLMSPEEAKKALRKADKVFRETQESAIATSKLDDLRKTLEEKSDYELYQRILGEAEARAVEKRMNMTPQERRATFPSYDVPLNEIIIRR
jgi:hypothetical protein